jgi:hypothetical protein
VLVIIPFYSRIACVHACGQNSYARAKALLRQKEALLHDIANALMLHETLTGADIQQYASCLASLVSRVFVRPLSWWAISHIWWS